MDREQIEAEVRRLSPWYYRYDLKGVSTDITPPCDAHGHRVAKLPDVARRILSGASVLDVACNEGGYSFSALDCGASEVTGFDVRAINAEKARLVAAVRGESAVRFEVSDCDDWIANHPETVDFVFLCGLLYHLVEPWRTIDEYTRIAQRGFFVTCVLNGGDDGYTPFGEAEGIAASADPSLMSQMPNTSRTIVREFARNGFLPVMIAENRVPRADEFWGGCSLFFRRCSGEWSRSQAPSTGSDPVELYVVPDFDGSVDVMLYNWTLEPLRLAGEVHYADANGEPTAESGSLELTLESRVARPGGDSSESTTLRIAPASIPEGTVQLRALVRDPETGQVLAERVAPVLPRGPQ